MDIWVEGDGSIIVEFECVVTWDGVDFVTSVYFDKGLDGVRQDEKARGVITEGIKNLLWGKDWVIPDEVSEFLEGLDNLLCLCFRLCHECVGFAFQFFVW